MYLQGAINCCGGGIQPWYGFNHTDYGDYLPERIWAW